jgi:acyl-CoA thioesterase I
VAASNARPPVARDPTDPVRDIRVCFVGDSYVAGLGDSTGLGWVGRAVAHAHAEGTPLTSYNLGIRRNTSRDVASRLREETARRLAGAGDGRVIVSFGVNDTLVEDGEQRVPGAETLAAFDQMVRELSPTPVAMVGPPAVADDAHNTRIRSLNAALGTAAATLRADFFDVFTTLEHDQIWWEQLRLHDGYHPDAPGYERFFRALRDPLHEWIVRGR